MESNSLTDRERRPPADMEPKDESLVSLDDDHIEAKVPRNSIESVAPGVLDDVAERNVSTHEMNSFARTLTAVDAEIDHNVSKNGIIGNPEVVPEKEQKLDRGDASFGVGDYEMEVNLNPGTESESAATSGYFNGEIERNVSRNEIIGNLGVVPELEQNGLRADRSLGEGDNAMEPNFCTRTVSESAETSAVVNCEIECNVSRNEIIGNLGVVPELEPELNLRDGCLIKGDNEREPNSYARTDTESARASTVVDSEMEHNVSKNEIIGNLEVVPVKEQKLDPGDGGCDVVDNEMKLNLNARTAGESAEASGLLNCDTWRNVPRKDRGVSLRVEDNDEKTFMNFTRKKRITIDGNDQPPRKKRQIRDKTVYRFGNYKRYYGYRLGKTMDEDPRLTLFQREWFEGKECLDVGCNEGFITISIAQKFMCRSILGVDIDKGLIAKARNNLETEAWGSEGPDDGLLEGGCPEEIRDTKEVSEEAEANRCKIELPKGGCPEETRETREVSERTEGNRHTTELPEGGCPEETRETREISAEAEGNQHTTEMLEGGCPEESRETGEISEEAVENQCTIELPEGRCPEESREIREIFQEAEGNQCTVELLEGGYPAESIGTRDISKETERNQCTIELLDGVCPEDIRGTREISEEAEGNQCTKKIDGGRSCSTSQSLLQRVNFKAEQFIKDFPDGDFLKDGMFDTVLCLSITKWVHLNWGDEGLIRLFAKIFRILRPGGRLILEPQPWTSYRKSKVLQDLRDSYNTIVLRPLHFKEILLDRIGFKSVQELSPAVPNSSVGFDRPIFLYLK